MTTTRPRISPKRVVNYRVRLRKDEAERLRELAAAHNFESLASFLRLSPTLRQSGELFKKCAGVYQALGRPVPSDSESALQLELENGSRIVSLPCA
jgi:hypothetical protein